jgi:bacteriophage N4 adsorption protein B
VFGALWYELAFFAAFLFLIGGVDDLIVDVIWLVRPLWRAIFVFSRHKRMTYQTLPKSDDPKMLAIFIPAWKEANVIGQMLRHTQRQWGDDIAHSIFVGCYPNDMDTQNAARALNDPRIHVVVCPHDGPTTKADCLNALWRALLADEDDAERTYAAIILHDAEDLVHPCELQIYRHFCGRFGMVQIPVIPLSDPQSRWVAGHYLDEFAESHRKDMVIREAVGASLPLAGVGCGLSRDLMAAMDAQSPGQPFDDQSLTEDYELGLNAARYGFEGAFVRMQDDKGDWIAVRAHFPSRLDDAVRQKTRWITGIALAGWDRLGWRGGLIERWMRYRDRRAIFAALALFAAYAALILTSLAYLVGIALPMGEEPLYGMVLISTALLCWRTLVRFVCVAGQYGLREGLYAIPRTVVSNVIAMIAARRAVFFYMRYLKSGILSWDKTTHSFPQIDAKVDESHPT